MTKEAYYEMCEMLGSEPLIEEIPVEFEDLPLEVQEIYNIYNLLQDTFDPVSGKYLGKNLAGLVQVMEIYTVEDKITCLKLIMLVDSMRVKYRKEKSANSEK